MGVMSGYTLPSGVSNTTESIKAKQRELGVTADGVWGPKSQAAYEANNPQKSTSLADSIASQLMAPKISYNMPSQSKLASQISAYLRPQYDQAIAARQDQTLTNRAEIDTDAASRGMGRSTWVTDVKDRAMDAEASDIANLESNYQAALAEAVQQQYNQNLSNKLAVDQFNATMETNAKGAAYQYALAQQKSNGKVGGEKSDDAASLLDEAQAKYGKAGTAFVNLDSFSKKYSKAALDAAKAELYSQIKIY